MPTPYTKANFAWITSIIRDWIASLDVHTKCAALAADRSDATTYAGGNPVFTVQVGPLDRVEDLYPLILVDPSGGQHDTARKAADNYAQVWTLQYMIACGVHGATREECEARAQDAVSVLINAITGPGARLGTERSDNSLNEAYFTQWGWSTYQRDDGFLSVAQLSMSVSTNLRYQRV